MEDEKFRSAFMCTYSSALKAQFRHMLMTPAYEIVSGIQCATHKFIQNIEDCG